MKKILIQKGKNKALILTKRRESAGLIVHVFPLESENNVKNFDVLEIS